MTIRLRNRIFGAAGVCLAALVLLAAAPGRAHAAQFMLSIMQDDNQLVYGNGAQRERALSIMKSMGVDAVRVSLLWDYIAPHKKLRHGADPKSYPAATWDRFDELARSAEARGIEPIFDVTGPGPKWTHPKAPLKAADRAWKPDPTEYGRFFNAVATRYSGTYRDENNGQQLLPRVRAWEIYNEPNFHSWLAPQSARSSVNGRTVPVAPALYRDLLVAGAKALIRTGHVDDNVTIGETAPLGSAKLGVREPLRPALFIREMFCLDSGLHPYRGAAAKARRCDRVNKLQNLAPFTRLSWAHHPYTKRDAPTTANHERDSITMSNIGALPRLLDRVAKKRKGTIPTGMPVILTEFGYESNPPDPFGGVKLQQQAEYINEGDYLAYRQPRVFANTQFQLDDVPPLGQYPRDSRLYWRTYQSGLIDLNGKLKPAGNAYILPIALRKGAPGQVAIWGQLRFTPHGSNQTVYLQAQQGQDWTSLGDPVTVSNNSGFFTASRPAATGTPIRAVWVAADQSDVHVSRTALAP